MTVEHRVNFNGELLDDRGQRLDDKATAELIDRHDLVVYLGDGDGHDACRTWANTGATVLCLDTYRASAEAPKLAEKTPARHGGRLIHITQVSAKAPDTWAQALRLALSAARQ